MERALADDVAAITGLTVVSTILDVVCRMTGMGFAAVARVTDARWIACSVRDEIGFGLEPGGELELETTICHEIRQHREPVIIDHVDADARYRNHHTPARYGFQSYISVPIMLRDGSFFGTLCAIDPKPAHLDRPEVVEGFRLFAELIAFHLETAGQMAATHAALAGEREKAALREQFIAVLGHDLRNPLAAVQSGVHLLEKEVSSPRGHRLVDLMRQSVGRMAGLVDNILDFARGRLGDGIPLATGTLEPIEPLVRHVIAELRQSHPEATIRLSLDAARPVVCDPSRLSQLFSNLIGNAITHGAAGEPVLVDVRTADDRLAFAVGNAGAPIAPEAMARLFEPFARGEVRPNQAGLGLGLYIASEIARAHGGTIEVTSDMNGTRFLFRMPLSGFRSAGLAPGA